MQNPMTRASVVVASMLLNKPVPIIVSTQPAHIWGRYRFVAVTAVPAKMEAGAMAAKLRERSPERIGDAS